MGHAATSSGIAPSDRVVLDSLRRFQREVDRLGAGPIEASFVWLGDLMAQRPTLREATLAAGRPDRMLLVEVPAYGASLSAVLPFSGPDALPAEFSAYIEQGTPGIAACVRRGRSDGRWRVNLASSGPAGAAMRHSLDSRSSLRESLAWEHYFDSTRALSLDWAFQIVPYSAKYSRVFMRTGQLGARRTEHGLASFLTKLPEAFQVLAELEAQDHRPIRDRAHPMFPCLAAAF